MGKVISEVSLEGWIELGGQVAPLGRDPWHSRAGKAQTADLGLHSSDFHMLQHPGQGMSQMYTWPSVGKMPF